MQKQTPATAHSNSETDLIDKSFTAESESIIDKAEIFLAQVISNPDSFRVTKATDFQGVTSFSYTISIAQAADNLTSISCSFTNTSNLRKLQKFSVTYLNNSYASTPAHPNWKQESVRAEEMFNKLDQLAEAI